MAKLSVFLIVIFSLFVGCTEKSPSDTAKNTGQMPAAATKSGTPAEMVQKTIRRYNQLLAEGYKKLNMTQLQEVATEDLALKAYYHAAALTEGKSRMVSEMKNIDFIKTDFDQPTKCRVITKENWDFAYVDILTGDKKQEVKNYIYHVSYVLENKQGVWTITQINATGEENNQMPPWQKIFEQGSTKKAN